MNTVSTFPWGAIAIIVSTITGFIGLLVFVIGFFVRKWMAAREEAEKTNSANMIALDDTHRKSIETVAKVATDAAAAVTQVATNAAAEVARVTEANKIETLRLTTEIKAGIENNRAEYINTGKEIKASIDALSIHVQRTNGRVTDLEKKRAIQEAIEAKINDGTLCKPRIG